MTDQPVDPADDLTPPHPHMVEPHSRSSASRLNWLRAGVLGANDGIISTAGLLVGVAGATTDRMALVTAGVAGVVAGSLSMGGGEYVSVSTQRDTEQALIAKETWELANIPDEELEELTQIYQGKGLTPELAAQVAVQLTAHDALRAHAEVELNLDPDALTNPWHAAWASMLSFALGAALPLIAILLPGPSLRVPITVLAVLVALTLTGYLSARLGGAKPLPAVTRIVGVGLAAMLITYGVGALVGTAI